MIFPGIETSDSMVTVRFLLKPGRKYEEAVEQFSPYRSAEDDYFTSIVSPGRACFKRSIPAGVTFLRPLR